MLETIVDGMIVTTNTARAGDMRISRTNGDSYFLPYSKFTSLYQASLESEGSYKPKPRTLKALKLTKSVTFAAPWGTRQTIPEGGYIVVDQKERWGVHPESFEATYKLGTSS